MLDVTLKLKKLKNILFLRYKSQKNRKFYKIVKKNYFNVILININFGL